MAFLVRTLSDLERSVLNLGALGVEQSRSPTAREAWQYAIDDERSALFTQLLSSTGEMRDGTYFYLLILRGHPFVFEFVPGFGMKLQSGASGSGSSAATTTGSVVLAKEAYDALCKHAA
jgi:hypothetical protein